MINIPASMLISLPQSMTSGIKMALPWPTGSIISAQVLQQQDAGMATLMLGGQKMQAKVPGFLPLGNIWLQLMERGSPSQFRLLSESRAVEVLAERLAQMVTGSDHKQSGHQSLRQEWPMPSQQNQESYLMHPSANGNRLFLEDRENGSAKGMIQKEVDEERTALHGRLDLEHLGTVFFAVEKTIETPFQLKLRASDHRAFISLQAPFDAWLKEKSSSTEAGAALIQGRLSEGEDPIIKPDHSVKRVA